MSLLFKTLERMILAAKISNIPLAITTDLPFSMKIREKKIFAYEEYIYKKEAGKNTDESREGRRDAPLRWFL